MQPGRRTRTILSWAICLMVLAGSFASAARLRLGAVTAQSNWIEVCTASGMKWVSPPSGTDTRTPTDDHAQHQSGHCPWCSAYAAAMGMPPSPLVPWQAPLTGRVLPSLFLAAPEPLFAWASAQARAPPRSV